VFWEISERPKKTGGGGVTHCGLAIYIKKYLKAKKKIMKIQIFHHAKKYNLQKNPLKETKILQDIITLYNKSQVSTQAKIYHLSKNPHIKQIDLLFIT
jgi:hypothetical protein